jgi:sulfide:quinone oxidoreductase
MTPHVVIAGGGVGALEALLALQSVAGHRLRLSVLTASRHLTYRALSVVEPFGGDPTPRFEWEHIARDRGVRWITDTVEGIRTGSQEVLTRDGPAVRYDALLLALGARPQPAIPGAMTFAGPRDVLAFREALEALEPGRRHRIAFVASAGVGWTLPLYELALQTAVHARRHGLDLDLELVTREADPLGAFGQEASAAVARRLISAGVRLRTATFAQEYDDGRLWLELEGPLQADLVVALPRLSGPGLPGLPATPDGFVPVDAFGRVSDVPHVWAVGDMTTRVFKQGGLAAQQADVAAADVASQLLGLDLDVTPYRPVLHGTLLTGEDALQLQRGPTVPAAGAGHKVVGRHLGPYLAKLGMPIVE